MTEKPTRRAIAKLVEDLQDEQRRIDKLTETRPGDIRSSTFVLEPDPSSELVERARLVAKHFDVPKAKQWVRDPHSVNLSEVISELGALRRSL